MKKIDELRKQLSEEWAKPKRRNSKKDDRTPREYSTIKELEHEINELRKEEENPVQKKVSVEENNKKVKERSERKKRLKEKTQKRREKKKQG